ncbi:MAG: hypothetical protein J1E84_02755 [Muribaculaceae bacterium]|nr:hypothetical protein [Muribaculaceae bacterium]
MPDKPTPRRRWRRSQWLPCLLLVYLAVMSYIGYPEFQAGNYLHYFGVIGITLIIIVLLRIFLKKRENIK